MPHFHYCIHAPLCHHRMRCDGERKECPRDDVFECLECCVREFKERRPEAFIESATVAKAETKKGKSKKGNQKEVLFQS